MKWIRWILCLILVHATTQLSAEPICTDLYSSEAEHFRNYIFGVNYKQSWIKPKGDWRQLFVRTQPGFDVYFGWRFHPMFEVDLGYEWTADKPLSIEIPNNASLLGITNTSGFTVTSVSKIRYKSGHADLNFYFPLFIFCDFVAEGILTAGVAGMLPSMKIHMLPLNRATSLFTSQFVPIRGRSMAVFRGGLGFQTMLIEDVGMRVLWRYEGTSVLRGRNSVVVERAATREIFKNGQSIAVGLFLRY